MISKRQSLIKISKRGIERLVFEDKFSEYESLDGHANSIKIRFKKEIN